MAKRKSSLQLLPEAIKYLALCRLVFQKPELGLSISVGSLCTIDAVVRLLPSSLCLSASVQMEVEGMGDWEGDKEFVSGRGKARFDSSTPEMMEKRWMS